MDDHAHRLELHQVLERGLGRLDAEARVLEAGGRVETAVGRLDRVVRVGGDLTQGAQGVPGLEGAGVDDAVPALGLRVHLDGDRAVGADRVAARDPGGLDDRQGRAEGAAGGDDDGVRARGAAQRVPHLRGHPPVVVDEGAVDVEADQQRLPVEPVEVLDQTLPRGGAVGGRGGGAHARQCAIGRRRTGEPSVTKSLAQSLQGSGEGHLRQRRPRPRRPRARRDRAADPPARRRSRRPAGGSRGSRR